MIRTPRALFPRVGCELSLLHEFAPTNQSCRSFGSTTSSKSSMLSSSAICHGSNSVFSSFEFVKTLEASTRGGGPWSLLPGGEEAGKSLLEKEVFHATVHPDLPPVNSLLECFKSPRKAFSSSEPVNRNNVEGSWQVHTVAAQLQSTLSIQSKISSRVGKISSSKGKGALLFVSGGHPLRSVPLVKNFLPSNSEKMLLEAHNMRRQCQINSEVEFWAVENPMANGIDKLEQKIAAGAEAIITQPPLLQDKFFSWWEKARSHGLVDAVPVIVGVPIISSSKNLEFWLQLTNASGTEADAVLEKYTCMERSLQSNPEDLEQFQRDYTRNMIAMVKELPGVAGMHVMPVSKRGWRVLPTVLDVLLDF